MSNQPRVEINKVELIDGEELQGMIKKVIDAIARGKGKTKKSLQLTGIFKDHVITRDFESGRFFRMKMERDGESVKLSEEVEVKQVFVPVAKTEKAEDAASCLVAIDGDVLEVKLDAAIVTEVIKGLDGDAPDYQSTKETCLWKGVL